MSQSIPEFRYRFLNIHHGPERCRNSSKLVTHHTVRTDQAVVMSLATCLDSYSGILVSMVKILDKMEYLLEGKGSAVNQGIDLRAKVYDMHSRSFSLM